MLEFQSLGLGRESEQGIQSAVESEISHGKSEAEAFTLFDFGDGGFAKRSEPFVDLLLCG